MASIFEEYISKRLNLFELKDELKRLVKEYNALTGHNLFIFASDLNKGRQGVDVSLMQDDFYTIQDMLRESDKRQIDVYLETPGGSGETAEEIAKFLHKKFDEVNFVIAGEAKSAGTILALSGDNIHMCETGSLGPIDAQVRIGRSTVSAHDYLSWVEAKKVEADKNGKLNPFDAIMVAQISPGEINGVINSLEYAEVLVKDWLVKYKFKKWNTTEKRGAPVTEEMKRKRAEEIAQNLCDHMNWKTHGRSLKMDYLKEWLKIEDIDDTPALANIVYRIKTIIRLIFDTSSEYKIYFWENLHLARTATTAMSTQQPTQTAIPSTQNNGTNVDQVMLEIKCPKCGKEHKIPGYFNISSEQIKEFKLPTNDNVKGDVFICDSIGCGFTFDLKTIKNNIESQSKKRIIFK